MVPDSPIFSCYNIDGILGVDILKFFNWTIDYKNKRLILHDPSFEPTALNLMHELAFTYKKDKPEVQLTIKERNIDFLLDTGASDSDIRTKELEGIDLAGFESHNQYSGFYDVKGDLTPTTSVVSLVPMSSNDVSLTALLSAGTKSSKLGNSLWEGTTLFMNLTKEKLYVSDRDIKEETAVYGAGVVFLKNKMSLMVIYEDSDAWNAGLRQGDEILQINGRVFTDFCSFDQYQRGLIAAGGILKLTLKDGKEIIIEKKELFAAM